MKRSMTWLLGMALLCIGCPGCGDDSNPGQQNNNNNQLCGNGVLDGPEECDGFDTGGVTCAELAPGSVGTVLCTNLCTFDTVWCSPAGDCGNGVAELGEPCDLADLRGSTCGDVVSGSFGTLACAADCSFDTTDCVPGAECGNGLRELGEGCDCGLDAANRPVGCTDANGGPNANCTAECEFIHLCGDGIRTGGEQCDCGHPSLVAIWPGYCNHFNGDEDGTCNLDCTPRR